MFYIKRTTEMFKRVQDDKRYAAASDSEADFIDAIKKEIDDFETITISMLNYMEETDITHEDVLNKCSEASKYLDIDSKQHDLICPECGQKIQESNIFIRKCMYCGYKSVTNPFQEMEN